MMSALHVGQSSSSVDANNDNDINNEATATSSGQDARFSCNICFDAVTEPVVTRCGHLYCWQPCLYRWLAPGMTSRERASLGMRPSSEPLTVGRRVCPVCKSECSVSTVVPIYVRNNDDTEPEQPPHPIIEQPQSPPVPLTDTSDGNMGLDIDDDYPDNVVVEETPEHRHDTLIPTTITTTSTLEPEPSAPPPAGLRQRRREQDNGEDAGLASTAIVPTRQMLLRDRAATAETNSTGIPQRTNATNTSNNNNNNNNNNGPTPNHHARATLSYGLVLAMYQMFLNATNSSAANGNGNTMNNGNPDATEAVPSLHYPQQRRDATTNMPATNEDLDSDPAATIFLSRLLLLLSLFVLVCLLLF